MFEHWKNEYPQSAPLDNFITYFKDQWVDNEPYNTWPECASDFCSTNNPLERFNKTIKDSHTLREKENFRTFIQTVEGMVSFWSACPEFQVNSRSNWNKKF